MRLANKVAIITGGGSGIGKASSYLFAKEGAKIVVAQRTQATGEETAAAINSSGGEAIFVRTDVSVASEVEHLVKVTKNTFGKIDVLFNNAGILLRDTPVEDTEEYWWDRIYAVHVKGIFFGAKYVVPEMKKTGGGVIINTSSTAGFRPLKDMPAYASSKGAAITLTKALALDLGPYNIRVNCIIPGITDTPMNADVPGEVIKEFISTVPIRRQNSPEDVAYAALYLASDESSTVTGAIMNVDGGVTI